MLASLLTILQSTVGLTLVGWGVGLACGAVTTTAVAHSRVRCLGPADLVTVGRVSLACAVAALVADSFVGPPATGVLVTLTAAALVLDAVDGRVARRTGTASRFGAHFDGEADAFLLLVLSTFVASTLGWWVLAIGVMRYAFAVAGWALPWLRADLPPRHWRKVVTATQGIVLLVTGAGLLPAVVSWPLLLGALGMLSESFGRDVWWLWHRRPAVALVAGPARLAGAPGQPL